MSTPSYKIATLIFIENSAGDQLLLHRHQSPNQGLWTPIGGKLHTKEGESPVECAVRETKEEANLTISPSDLHLFGYLAETDYEGQDHWLIFLFHCLQPVEQLPEPIKEGEFGFHALASISDLPIPPSDRDILWPVFHRNRTGFTGIRIQYHDSSDTADYTATIEQEIKGRD